jgi:hypothetical protein
MSQQLELTNNVVKSTHFAFHDIFPYYIAHSRPYFRLHHMTLLIDNVFASQQSQHALDLMKEQPQQPSDLDLTSPITSTPESNATHHQHMLQVRYYTPPSNTRHFTPSTQPQDNLHISPQS